ncbi:MAG: hypothetical protein ACI8QT_000969 [Halioglobus sp.]|jgi:hypothetical protein
MHSWKTIRIVSAILLLIPIIHLAVLVSRDALTALDSSPTAWNSELEAYVKADRLVERHTEPILVIGGRRVLLWQGLEALMSPMPIMMRGLGDATVTDLIFHYERLVAFYRPQTVVLLTSNSEFHIRDMKSAEDLVDGIQELVELDFSVRSRGMFYVFTPLNTKLYPQDKPKIEKITRQLESWADTDERVVVLDANRLLSDASGSPKPDYFRPDGVNLNELGYLRLSMLLMSQIKKDNPEADVGL